MVTPPSRPRPAVQRADYSGTTRAELKRRLPASRHLTGVQGAQPCVQVPRRSYRIARELLPVAHKLSVAHLCSPADSMWPFPVPATVR